jgi:hypothetical protein
MRKFETSGEKQLLFGESSSLRHVLPLYIVQLKGLLVLVDMLVLLLLQHGYELL